MQGPQYIVGRSYPPTNGTAEEHKVGKVQSKGLKTSFQQSLRRSKHEGSATRQHQKVGGPGGEVPTRASLPASESREEQSTFLPVSPQIGPVFLGAGLALSTGARARGCGSRDRICPGPVRARH